MTNNRSKSLILRGATIFLSIIAWVLIWALLAKAFDFDIVFPGPILTLKTLSNLITKASFWKAVAYSFYRIFSGLILGIAIGVCITVLGKAIPLLHTFISIGMSVVKSTPIASIVLILWVLVSGGTNLPIIIAVIMVCPIIWQNLTNGFNSIDKSLLEVARVFEFSKAKIIRTVYLPPLLNHFIPAVLASIGLAWKAGISAEVIAYTKNSIGYNISNAKAYFEGDVLFAWTLVVVLISLLFEYLAKILLRRFKTKNA